MKILFLVHAMSRIRHFESVIRSLTERGHTVTIGASPKNGRMHLDSSLRHPNVRVIEAPHQRSDAWGDFPLVARLARDYVRFLDPRYDEAPRLRWRAQRMLKGVECGLLWMVGTRPWAARYWKPVGLALKLLEDVIPTDPAYDAFLEQERPDLILITPLVNLNSYQADYVKSAHKLGIPIAFLPFSWDNLTSKGLIKILPDWVVVWNDVQKREAVELHGVPSKRVVVTGAPRFDGFFELKPETTRKRFCAEHGLDPARPFILYLCSSAFVAQREAAFVRRWVTELRAAADPRLQTCGVLLRAHPANREYWEGLADTLGGLDGDASSLDGVPPEVMKRRMRRKRRGEGLTGRTRFVRRMIAKLRASAHPRLQSCGVLPGAHPATRGYWGRLATFLGGPDGDASGLDGVPPEVVKRRMRRKKRGEDLTGLTGVALQIPKEWRNVNQDLYDGLYHAAAVVGLNTSALLEAGILGKSVHTVLAPEYAEGQEGTLHFHYLLEANGGLLSVAKDFQEHCQQLSRALDAGGAPSERSLRFVEGFLRPHGLGTPATPITVREIERMGGLKKRRRLPTPPWHVPMRWLLQRWFPEDFQRDRPADATTTLEAQASLIDDGPDAVVAGAASDAGRKRRGQSEVPLAPQARWWRGRRGSVQTLD